MGADGFEEPAESRGKSRVHATFMRDELDRVRGFHDGSAARIGDRG